MYDPEQIPIVLEKEQEKAPPEAQNEYYLEFETLWERKLWHELTDLLLKYFKLPESASQRSGLFKGFIRAFDDKINQLKLVNLGLLTAETEGGKKLKGSILRSFRSRLIPTMKTSRAGSPFLKSCPDPSTVLLRKRHMLQRCLQSQAYGYSSGTSLEVAKISTSATKP